MNYMRASVLFMPLKAAEEQCGSLFFSGGLWKVFLCVPSSHNLFELDIFMIIQVPLGPRPDWFWNNSFTPKIISICNRMAASGRINNIFGVFARSCSPKVTQRIKPRPTTRTGRHWNNSVRKNKRHAIFNLYQLPLFFFFAQSVVH